MNFLFSALLILDLTSLASGAAVDDLELNYWIQQVDRAVEKLAPPVNACEAKPGAEPNTWIRDPEKPNSRAGVIQCKPSKSHLFKSSEPLEIEIQTDFEHAALQSYPAEGMTDEQLWAKAVKGRIVVQNGKKGGLPIDLKIGLTARAKSRFGYCQFKPLKLLFPEDQKLDDTVFDHLKSDEIKLIVHCNYTSGKIDDDESHLRANEKVKREYAVYQTLKAAGYLVPNARLAKIQYKNQDGSNRVQGYGVLVEPKGSLAKRCACGHFKKTEMMALAPAAVEKTRMMGFLFARHLSATMDWIVGISHNSIPLHCDKNVRGVASYDFNDSELIEGRERKMGNQLKNAKTFYENIAQGFYDRGKLEKNWRSQDSAFAGKGAEWDDALKEEVVRISNARAKVYQALEESPIEDKASFKAHFDDFFAETDKWMATQGLPAYDPAVVPKDLPEVAQAEDVVEVQVEQPAKNVYLEKRQIVRTAKVAYRVISARYLDRDVTERAQAQLKQDGALSGCGYWREKENLLDLNFEAQVECTDSKGKKHRKIYRLECIPQAAFARMSCP